MFEIGRTGEELSNRESPCQIGRVGTFDLISVNLVILTLTGLTLIGWVVMPVCCHKMSIFCCLKKN